MSETNAQNPPVRMPAPRKRRRWVTLLLTLVIFAAGFVAGGATAVAVGVRRAIHSVHHPEEAPRRIAGHLKRRLDLSDTQTEKVLAIVTARQQNLMAIRREVHPRVMAELNGAYDEVAAVLEADQKPKWRRLYDQLRRTWLPEPPPATTQGATGAPAAALPGGG